MNTSTKQSVSMAELMAKLLASKAEQAAQPAPVAEQAPQAQDVAPKVLVASEASKLPALQEQTAAASVVLTPAERVAAALSALKQQGGAQAVPAPAPAPKPLSKQQELVQQILAKRQAANPAAQALQAAAQKQELARAVAAANEFVWNEEQAQAIQLGENKESFVLVGAAGTGKTTCVRQVVVSSLIGYADSGETQLVACVAFTNRAVKNLRKSCEQIEDALIRRKALDSCSTIHKLLKFAPQYYDYEDERGCIQRTMRFEPTYTASNPLPVRLVIVDEASMVDLPLWKMLLEACPNARFIFIGDLNQLKPVFGLSVLGYKLLELPVVELTQVYRQAMESPILSFQHKFSLVGKQPSDTDLKHITESSGGKLTFFPLSKTRPPEEQARIMGTAMQKHYEAGAYNPYQDIILIPHNVKFGTVLLNQWIAQWLGDKRQAVVHEIACGMSKKYLAEGDFVVYNKEEYFVEAIRRNNHFSGKQPAEPSTELMRTGFMRGNKAAPEVDLGAEFDDLLAMAFEDDDSERKLAASHVVTIVLAKGASSLEEAVNQADPDDLVVLSTKGELNELAFGYALTVHKSQGSEWRKVFLAMTSHHAAQLNRELLYTAMTRAREELFVYYSPQSAVGAKDSSIAKAIGRPSIAGRTWREKCKHFADRVEEYEAFMAEPTQYGVQ